MIATELKFVHVGMGNIANASRIVAMIRPGSKCGARILKSAKQSGGYIDACLGRPMKTLILMDDGGVIGSAITPKTLMKRCNGEIESNVSDEDEYSEENEYMEEDNESN